MHKKDVSVIIVAAGNATRMGGLNKQLLEIDGIPVIMRSILTFEPLDEVYEIIIVTKKEDISVIRKLIEQYNITKPIKLVEGSDTRQRSVQNGIKATSDKTSYLAVHDGARPFAGVENSKRVIYAGYKYGAATTGVMSKDTVKILDEDGFVKVTPNRDRMYLSQTPQVFSKENYKKIENMGGALTDECQILESIGVKVFMAQGDYRNIKITTLEDIGVANAIAKDMSKKEV